MGLVVVIEAWVVAAVAEGLTVGSDLSEATHDGKQEVLGKIFPDGLPTAVFGQGGHPVVDVPVYSESVQMRRDWQGVDDRNG